jgi:hypothetical protein
MTGVRLVNGAVLHPVCMLPSVYCGTAYEIAASIGRSIRLDQTTRASSSSNRKPLSTPLADAPTTIATTMVTAATVDIPMTTKQRHGMVSIQVLGETRLG